MHIKAITKAEPAPAASLEVVLDLISQLIGVIRSLEALLGIDISQDIFGKEE